MKEKEPLVVDIVPRARRTMAVQNTGIASDMHRIAAWVLDNGGRASIKDGYDVQGPDMLHVEITSMQESQSVPQGWWIIYLSHGNFKIASDDEFNKIYEPRSSLKVGDER